MSEAKPNGLYERDALAWAERQSSLLRRLAGGEGVNEAVDWPNVIEEVRDVGLSELRASRRLLRQALVHVLKLHASPENPAAAHWRGEVAGFLADVRDRVTPSMRRRIGLDDLYDAALSQIRAGADDAASPRTLPEACPFTLDELLVRRPDVAALVGKLT